jgi:hypothetical protein
VVLLDQDALFHERLREGKGDNWHILDNVTAVRGNPVDLALAQNIVDVNRRIKTIIETKAGLLGDQVPNSFAKFIAHQDMLARALADQPYVKELETARYFPKEFEDTVRNGYQYVLTQMHTELGQT